MSTLKVNKSKKIATGWWMVIACILVRGIIKDLYILGGHQI